MSKLRQRKILEVLGFLRSQDIIALILGYMPRASLHDHWSPCSDEGFLTSELNWDERLHTGLHIATGVAYGLVCLHNHFHEPIIHRELKQSNNFITEE
jgi:serine/threonine protein kinase